uniref:PGG domain-containing protein n=1 Tax=Kalanchoe fedtschenkoi TaxID=63787 RepID=A0A7N0SWN9_KALFE
MSESTDPAQAIAAAGTGGSDANEGAAATECGDVPAPEVAAVAPLRSSEPEEEEEEVEAHMNRATHCSRSSTQLYKAVIVGDWERAEVIINSQKTALSEHITQVCETILHVSVGQPNTKFVQELVKSMTKEQLEQKDRFGRTALCSAAIAGNTEAVKILVNADPDLPSILSNRYYSPLHYAAKYGHKKTVRYLSTVTDLDYQSPHLTASGVTLLNLLISADFFAMACDQLRKLPDSALKEDSVGKDVFQTLAQKPSAFPNGNPSGYWKSFIYYMIVVEKQEIPTECTNGSDEENPQAYSKASPAPSGSSGFLQSIGKFFRKDLVVLWKAFHIFPFINKVYHEKLEHTEALGLLKAMCDRVVACHGDCFKLLEDPVRTAARLGIHEFVLETLSASPELIWSFDDENRHSIFHIAVLNRHEKIFSIIGKRYTHKHPAAALRDKDENNILHLAGRLGPCSEVSGAALHMQRELQWFKEVEDFVLPAYKEKMNKAGKTPRMVFSEAHKELVDKGGLWIRNTASACSIVASLIITTMFSAAIKFSYGANQSRPFLVFAGADAVGLFSSSTAVFMFLGILTSRCSEEDFLESLPRRLIIGLMTLFISIVAMMEAFGATLHILLFDIVGWVVIIPIAIVACLPIAFFIKMQFPLIVDMLLCTYLPSVFY